MNRIIDKEDALIMSADSKIGLLATIDDQGSPHISFLSSLQPFGSDRLTVGQFCAGSSKKSILERKQVGFLFFSPEMEIWSGRAIYESSCESGPEYELYNKKPMFRYNSYFGIGRVHYFRLVDISPKEKLTKGQIIAGALKTRMIAPFVSSTEKRILNEISREMFGQIDGLKFISYLDDEGFPCLVPVIQAANAGTDRVVFSMTPYEEDLLNIPEANSVAVLFVNLKMESVLIKGPYRYRKNAFIPHGRIDIERVYNSMPPQPGYIFPPAKKHDKVVEF